LRSKILRRWFENGLLVHGSRAILVLARFSVFSLTICTKVAIVHRFSFSASNFSLGTRDALSRRACIEIAAAILLTHCGRKVGSTQPNGALRIASLAPSLTETVFALGAGARLVGRTKYCDYPVAASTIPVVGGFGDVNWEALLAVRPTLVLATPGPQTSDLVSKTKRLGMDCLVLAAETVDEVQKSIAAVAEKIESQAAGSQLLAAQRAELRALQVKYKQTPRVRAVIAFGLDPLVLAGPKSFASELLELGGGDNAVTSGPNFANVPMEHLAALDPEVVLDAGFGAARFSSAFATRPGWGSLRAVRNSRVVVLTDEVVLRPGPRLALAAGAFATAMRGA
jgi:iron complex transport system substrate-binding protein